LDQTQIRTTFRTYGRICGQSKTAKITFEQVGLFDWHIGLNSQKVAGNPGNYLAILEGIYLSTQKQSFPETVNLIQLNVIANKTNYEKKFN
jgi:hypothetical protein